MLVFFVSLVSAGTGGVISDTFSLIRNEAVLIFFKLSVLSVMNLDNAKKPRIQLKLTKVLDFLV